MILVSLTENLCILVMQETICCTSKVYDVAVIGAMENCSRSISWQLGLTDMQLLGQIWVGPFKSVKIGDPINYASEEAHERS
ncbi:unnamed protein product [Citrullus colocynthis]|uniref:Uncharacterized protein n=1 Tax=Citrullus colocynthis TaxID=252529 RepID=A0ABP0YKI8_9ROSI